jgi:hypothetical protein
LFYLFSLFRSQLNFLFFFHSVDRNHAFRRFSCCLLRDFLDFLDWFGFALFLVWLGRFHFVFFFIWCFFLYFFLFSRLVVVDFLRLSVSLRLGDLLFGWLVLFRRGIIFFCNYLWGRLNFFRSLLFQSLPNRDLLNFLD